MDPWTLLGCLVGAIWLAVSLAALAAVAPRQSAPQKPTQRRPAARTTRPPGRERRVSA